MKDNYVVIMAGGIGTRFWPYSRTSHPKQFQDILGTGQTLLQLTVERFKSICPIENVYIVTNKDYYTLVKEQLPQLSDDQILLEPIMRNTAPCVAYACYKIHKQNPNASIIISPADHIVLKQDNFVEAIQTAIDGASKEEILLTLGILPTRPDTGYGYIQIPEAHSDAKVQKVKTFTEKPNLELALEFLDSGDYVWNAGIFIWSADSIIRSFQRHMPELAELMAEASHSFYTPNEKAAIEHAYYQCHNISIDYGIMEKAQNVYVVRCDLGWSDLGTWKSLYEFSEKNREKNVFKGNVLAYDTTNCLVRTPEDRLVVLQGLDNYIVVEYDNVLLVCQKDQEQRIKQFLEDVNRTKGPQYT